MKSFLGTNIGRFSLTFSFLALLAVLMVACGGNTPAWSLEPGSLSFAGQVGEPAPAVQSVTIKNSGGGEQEFTVSSNASWAAVTPASGRLAVGESASLQVSVSGCTESGSENTTLTVGGAAAGTIEVARVCAPAAGTLLWAKQFGTSDYDDAMALARGADGSLYLAGDTKGDFGETGSGNIFLARYDADGEREWLTQFQSHDAEAEISYIAAAESGVYVAGSLDYDHFEGQINAGESDVFIAKFTIDGEMVWLHQFGTPQSEGPSGLVVDSGGNAYLYGSTAGEFSDPSTDPGNGDLFLAKFKPDGTRAWLKQFGSDDAETATHVYIGPEGNIYLSGSTSGSLSGQPNSGAGDAFVAKYDPAGAQVWVSQFGTSEQEAAGSIALAGGVVYTGSSTRGAFAGFSNAGGTDIYVAALNDSTGQLSWVNQMGSGGYESAAFLQADENGVYVLGSTSGTLPGQTAAGDTDVFTMSLRPDGSQRWLVQFGTSKYDEDRGLELADGRLLVLGRTNGQFDGYTLSGRNDIFVAGFEPGSGERVWLNQFGSDQREWLAGLALDEGGHAYVFGQTGGVFPGQTSSGDKDVFLAKVQR
jgi:hypothetical protein